MLVFAGFIDCCWLRVVWVAGFNSVVHGGVMCIVWGLFGIYCSLAIDVLLM